MTAGMPGPSRHSPFAWEAPPPRTIGSVNRALTEVAIALAMCRSPRSATPGDSTRESSHGFDRPDAASRRVNRHRQPRIMTAERTRGTTIRVSTARGAAGRPNSRRDDPTLAGWLLSIGAMQKSQTRSVHFRIHERGAVSRWEVAPSEASAPDRPGPGQKPGRRSYVGDDGAVSPVRARARLLVEGRPAGSVRASPSCSFRM
jgi:hypothetical protein